MSLERIKQTNTVQNNVFYCSLFDCINYNIFIIISCMVWVFLLQLKQPIFFVINIGAEDADCNTGDHDGDAGEKVMKCCQ